GEVDAATRVKLPRLGQKAQFDPGSLTSVQILALIQERVKAAPEDVQALRMMGDIYASTGHLERAENAYRAGLEIAPSDRELIESWADARFKASQAIDVETSELYNR